MEQFNQLKWSWDTYEEDKQHPPRVFSFETIHEGDALSRTLNEIHKCVVPRRKKFHVLKTAEERSLVAGEDVDCGVVLEDPRKNPTRFLDSSSEMIKDYGYSSELSLAEQRTILNGILLKIFHNPKLLVPKNWPARAKQLTMTPQLAAKHKTEANHFNKCAEIFYYRHLNDFSTTISDGMKKCLTDHWKSSNVSSLNFQVITMLIRDKPSQEKIELHQEESSTEKRHFNPDKYLTSTEKFPNLASFSPTDLKNYKNLTHDKFSQPKIYQTCDVNLTLDLLSKIVINTEQFSVRFTNLKSNGKILSSFHEPLPLRTVSVVEALEEIVRTAIHASIDSWNVAVTTNEEKTCNDYRVEKIEAVIRKIYKKFKENAGINEKTEIWTLSKGEQLKIRMSLDLRNIYFLKNTDGSLVPVVISVKLEFQTKFGAERMTREELIKEWIPMRFSKDFKTLRYRVDAKTLEILSISLLSLEEIENELSVRYNLIPHGLFSSVYDLLSCMQRLPEGEFLIQSKTESELNKLFIYRQSDVGNFSENDSYEICSSFNRKWIEIDEFTPTFIHLNNNFAPGCFPCDNGFHKLSYVPSVPQKVKKEVKSVPGKKTNTAPGMIVKPGKKKRNFRKNLKRKAKIVGSLDETKFEKNKNLTQSRKSEKVKLA